MSRRLRSPFAPAVVPNGAAARGPASGTNHGRLGLILRRRELTDEEDAGLLADGPRAAEAVRLGLKDAEDEVRATTAAFVGRAGLLGSGAVVLPLLADPAAAVRAAAGEALIRLTDRADAVARDGGAGEVDRRAFVAALADAAAAGGAGCGRVCGWLAACAAARDAAVEATLRHETAGPALTRALAVDRHPGVARLLLGLLATRRPPPAARAAACRTDPAFTFPLLAAVGDDPRGLPGLPPLPWLRDPAAVLATVPAGLQPAAALLAQRACEPAAAGRAVRAWLLDHGSAPARRAAAAGLREMPPGRRARLLAEAVSSSDGTVAAWAAELLPVHNVPDWPRTLAALARGGTGRVREAASAALWNAAHPDRA